MSPVPRNSHLLQAWAGTQWQPISHPPRRLWIGCVSCGYSAINEDRSLRGWEETVNTPRRYRCRECVLPFDDPPEDAA